MQMLVTAELAAIHTAAALYPLTNNSFLRITGADATRWLNGMVTNNIRDLAPGEGTYNFLLNAQGRILGDCTIYRSCAEGATEFILETTSAQIDAIETLLESYIIMDEVELARVLYVDGTLPGQRGLAVLGKEAGTLLRRTLHLLDHPITQLPAPGHMLADRSDGAPLVVFAPPSSTIFPCFEVWCQSGLLLDLVLQNLLSMGAVALSPKSVEAHRVLSGHPRYGTDIRNSETARDLPQETGQTHALHFTKGCYLGQEIVERIRSRGQVHRSFMRFALTGAMPTLPAPLTATLAGQTRSAGELTSAIELGDTLHAIGYIRREFAAQTLAYPGGVATPVNG
jgi:folate-binding protein YgfZ